MYLFGFGSEDALVLAYGQFSGLNFQGLLLAGILIGALGVLDDITTTQIAAIDEIYKANPAMTRKELKKRSMSVGREHITSLVNTIALAYVGVSLPLLLMFTVSSVPFWTLINSELVVEELARTLIGSAALILAVSISTYFGIRYLVKKSVL